MTDFPSPPSDSLLESRRRVRRCVYLLIVVTAAGLLTAGLWNAKPLASANDRSRWCTVWALVEQGTYKIDEIDRRPGWGTIDKVRHEGHYYSTKPPLLSTLVAGVYWGVKQATGWELTKQTAEVTRFTLLLVNVLPMLIALIVLTRIVERYAEHDFTRLFVVAAAAFATLLTPFLFTLNNHTPAAVSAILALYPAMRIVAEGARSPWLFAAAGFFAAFTCCNELPAALFGLALFAVLHVKSPRSTWLYFVPAALVPLSAFFYTNYLATGGIKLFYMYYGTEKYEFVVDGVPSYWMEPKGVDRAVDTPLTYFFHCTLGHHGVLSLTPLFLLTLATALAGRCRREFALRWFVWMALGLTIGIFAFYLKRPENYNYGGVSCGLRWTFWLIPFWLVAMIPALDAWGSRRWFQILAGGLLAVSAFSAWYPANNPWQQPWLYSLMERWELIDYREKPPRFERPLQTWFPSLPDWDEANEPQWIELAGLDADGNSIRLRLTDAGPQTAGDGRTWRGIEVLWTQADGRTRRRMYAVDAQAFYEGRAPEEFLPEAIQLARWNADYDDEDAADAAGLHDEAVVFFRGLPAPRRYNNEFIRYLKTPLRRDAFRCQKAAGQVYHRPPNQRGRHRYRNDLWLCNDVPFGILQIDTSVFNASGELTARRRLTAVAASDISESPPDRPFVSKGSTKN